MNKDELDDVVFEETAEGEGEALSKDKIKKLREELKQVKEEKAEYLASWQKERADFINYKKDEDARKKDVRAYAVESFTEELLPVLDAYDMAFANKDAWEKVDETWRKGVEYIHEQLLRVLNGQGITEMQVKVGDTPDARLHEQVDTVDTEDESQDNTIAEVVQKGYMNGDRIVRPARVKVYSYTQ